MGSNIVNGHYFTTDEISGTIAHYSSAYYVNPDALEAEYLALKAQPKAEATSDSPLLFPERNHAVERYYYKPRPIAPLRSPYPKGICFAAQGGMKDPVQDILSRQLPNGSWLTPISQISNPYKPVPANMPQSNDTRHAQTMVGDEFDTSPFTPDQPVLGISTKDYIQYMTVLMNAVLH